MRNQLETRAPAGLILDSIPCDQVAAICFRLRAQTIEFLLVRTRGGRWTFPKGRTEPGYTYSQVAALEAYEEAGVYGNVEEFPFTRYLHRKRGHERELIVGAHLCHVQRLGRPQESGRDRTWFSAVKTKNRLCEGRNATAADELAALVDHAIARIERVHLTPATKDPLQQVVFEN